MRPVFRHVLVPAARQGAWLISVALLATGLSWACHKTRSPDPLGAGEVDLQEFEFEWCSRDPLGGCTFRSEV